MYSKPQFKNKLIFREKCIMSYEMDKLLFSLKFTWLLSSCTHKNHQIKQIIHPINPTARQSSLIEESNDDKEAFEINFSNFPLINGLRDIGSIFIPSRLNSCLNMKSKLALYSHGLTHFSQFLLKNWCLTKDVLSGSSGCRKNQWFSGPF